MDVCLNRDEVHVGGSVGRKQSGGNVSKYIYRKKCGAVVAANMRRLQVEENDRSIARTTILNGPSCEK